jgi:hypothetical protein
MAGRRRATPAYEVDQLRRNGDPGAARNGVCSLVVTVPFEEYPEFQMKKISLVALAAALICLPASAALAQAPAAGTDTPAAPAPAAPAPAASPADSTPADAGRKTATKKKKSGRRMTRQQEIDHSVQSGTVPSRYRSQVPKEYQQYIPFDKR